MAKPLTGIFQLAESAKTLIDDLLKDCKDGTRAVHRSHPQRDRDPGWYQSRTVPVSVARDDVSIVMGQQKRDTE